jgi:alpha-L-fucosidase
MCNNYGTIWEMWWDGANSTKLDSVTLFNIADTIHRLQPSCAIWSDAAGRSRTAEMRWNGNESAQNGDPCWATMDVAWSNANTGVLNAARYVPAEGDISARDGWFWHSTGTLKTLAALINAYCYSLGRNGGLLLNVPPNTTGRIPTADSIRVDSLGMWVYGTFDTNLAAGATVTALHTRGNGYEPANLVDGQESTYYAALDANRTDTITFNLNSSKTFNAIMVQEVIQLGHRTTGWAVQSSTNGTTWTAVTGATGKQSIGYKWIIRITTAVTASYVRLCITAGNACPAIHTFGIYQQGYLHQPTTAVGPQPAGTAPLNNGFNLRIVGGKIFLPAAFANTTVTIELLDSKGRLLKRITSREAIVDLRENWAAGMYIVKCSSGNMTIMQKAFGIR